MKPSWIACWVSEKRARDHRLAGDDRGGQRQKDHRNAHQIGDHQEERILDRRRGSGRIEREHHRPLPHVVEHQGRQHECQPADPDRLAPEVAHVGIKRLSPGHRQHNAAHRNKGAKTVGHEEVDRVERVDRRENDLRHARHVHHAHRRQGEEIGQHDRAEQFSHPIGAARLNGKKGKKDRHRNRHDPRFEARMDILQALGRREHRHRRRYHRIAIEQGCGKHPEQDERPGPFGPFRLAVDERQQCQAAALALVVRLHDGEDIFERHHDHH